MSIFVFSRFVVYDNIVFMARLFVILIQWICSLAPDILVEGSPIRREESLPLSKQGVELCPSDAKFTGHGLRESVLWSP